ncbi:polysaccharide biosynthesis tyrosine autokinase [Marivirga sp. S37H4]|uniref:non-specific protein-tyrosine kinase n=1 Tax=Marivirga aurantiaca TaxID=2802615 RepID=A0A934WZU3_9BACT|nr:tyrosine-protein kinase [Marivirga aurantiaca]MBK6265801.1 polysaccharide biosynthesis tyrosine autokinase [Marivirga aurantiaca]
MENINTKYQRDVSRNKTVTASRNHEMIDFRKFFILLKKNILWILLFFIISSLSVFIYIRYTNVKFQSYAELKLNKRSEASVFGFNPMSEESSNLNTLSGEVELIRSKLFLKQVIKKLPLDVTYEVIGRFKNEERYKFIPFEVKYEEGCAPKHTKFFVKVIDHQKFKISFNPEEGNWQNGVFNQDFVLAGCNYQLQKTEGFFDGETLSFYINSEESLLDYIGSNLAVAPENLNANTIKMTFADYNIYKVQSIVEAISELYIEYSREQKNKANQLKIEFLNDQLKQTENVLAGYEIFIEEFTIENKTTNPSNDINRLIGEIVKMDSILYGFRFQLNELNKVRGIIHADSIELEQINASLLPDNVYRLFDELIELNTSLQMAKMRYKSNSQIISETQQRKDLLLDRVIQMIDSKITDLKERSTTIIDRKRSLENSFRTLPGKNNELNQKMRFYSLYEELYLSLMQKKTEFEIAQAGTLAEVVILTPANLPKSPIGPSRNILYLGAFAISLVLSFIFIMVRYLIYDEINSLSELERITHLPIIGSISRLKSSIARKSGVIVFERPRSQISEAFRTLRTGLNFMGINEGKNIISISSSTSGEGKTFVAVNLAAILSLSNKRTIILDLDMRKPRAQYAFNVGSNDEGISAILSGGANWQDCVLKTQNENLHFIPSGLIPPNPAELLESGYFDQLLMDLKQKYDVILLDTPPIGLVSDGIIALKKSDHSIFVVRADYSKRSFIKDLHRSIELNGIRNISIVYNAAKKGNNGYGYYQDYYNDNGSKSLSTLKRIFNI